VASFTPDTDNEMFQLAIQLVNQTNRNIFLTGKAGTGKTTFLRYILENCPKQIAIVAPTGVAAINAGGVTIHSFFQLPLQPFAAESKGTEREGRIVNRHELLSRLRMNKEKRKVLQQLELLIIDEISMVRSDMMDAIDAILRHTRRRPHELFGGVQVLMIGDLFQLPPVKNEAAEVLMAPYYKSNFFFDSNAMLEQMPLYIEFNKIYRQRDETFIQLLNQVRNNELNAAGSKILENRYDPDFIKENDDGYIILTTHNHTAREINNAELKRLETKSLTYKAAIENDFGENAYPADEVLELKTGAQVMYIKNDSDKSKRFYNGKLGIVTRLEADKIWVKSRGDAEEIEVKKEKWENIRYSLNKATQLMDPNVIGSFSQYPLRLAWAITIHKSQGLTFEKAVIDAGRAFEPGQVYVALSRCTSLEGIILRTRISADRLSVNNRIISFSNYCSTSQKLHDELEQAKRNYKQQMLVSTFDIATAVTAADELNKYIAEHSSSFTPDTSNWLTEKIASLNTLQTQTRQFHDWINVQFQKPEPPEENELLQRKTKDAVIHFDKHFTQLIDSIQKCPALTDSKLHAKELNEGLREVLTELSVKKFLLQGFSGQLDAEGWHSRKRKFIAPSFAVNTYAGAADQKTDSAHPRLYMQLKMLRDAICAHDQLPIYIVAGSATLNEMSAYLPHSLEELRKISGFGDAKVKKYGQEFLDVIIEYCNENGLNSLMHEKSPKRERKEKSSTSKKKGETHAISFGLYKEGKSIESIAGERKLTISTIEGHLAYYAGLGEVTAEQILGKDKTATIKQALKGFDGKSVTSVKIELGDEVSFGEIRLVLAEQKFNGIQ
jgi:nucleoside-triphosphatase THEP1